MVSSMSLSEVVSSQGRFIAAKTARGTAQPEPPTQSRAQRPPCLPASSLPPSLSRPGKARLPRRRGRLLAALSHAAAGLGRKNRRRPRPSARAGPPRPPPARRPPPPRRVPPPRGRRGLRLAGAGGRGRARQCLSASLLPRRGNAAAHLGPGSSARAGEAAASVSARLITPARAARGRGRGRGGGGP